MNRAVILIGVKKSGSLPELRAVDDGIRQMKKWATEQSIPPDAVTVLTDETEAVYAHNVFQAVKKVVERDTVEQLVIYFAGHGVNNGQSEFLLLSDAPGNPNEAINVEGSAQLARRGGIPHVVLISDACRTRPDSISALSVKGSEIFPNQSPTGPEASVDLFYACLLGDPANEFGDPDDAAAVYRSIYTEVLLEALRGEHPGVLKEGSEGGQTFRFVRPWPLKRGLPSLVTQRIVDENLWRKISQTPDARLSSDPELAWLARHPLSPLEASGPPPASAVAPSLPGVAIDAIHDSMDPAADPGGRGFVAQGGVGVEGARELQESADMLAEDYGPPHYESGAGFKLRGATVVEAVGAIDTELLDEGLVRVWGLDARRPATSVALRFASGPCAVLPAVHGYMGSATVVDGRLVDVAYEPMDTTAAWADFEARAPEIRRVRSTLAAAARMGLTSMDRETAMATARHLDSVRGLDPSSVLYAAYAFRDLGDESLIEDTAFRQFGERPVLLYDLELLQGRPPEPGPRLGPPPWVFPSFPMLSRGWALTNAMEAEIHPSVADPSRRIPSLWTLFAADAFSGIAQALFDGDLQ